MFRKKNLPIVGIISFWLWLAIVVTSYTVIDSITNDNFATASILDRKYTFDKLDEFWNSNFKNRPPQTSWFEEMASNGQKFPTVIKTTSSSVGDDLPFDGVLIGEETENGSGGSGGGSGHQGEMKGFPVIPIPVEVAQKLYQRLPLLEIYLNRYSSFASTSTDTSEQLTLLRQRYYSVGVEVYLSNLLRYFSESTFQKKCDRLQRASLIMESLLREAKENDLLPEWRVLWPIYENAKNRMGNDILKPVVCTVSPAETRAQIQKKVKDLVQEMLYFEVSKKVEETVVLLNGVSGDFQKVVNEMNGVQIKTTDIMEFEQTLRNVSSNLLLVKNDSLKEQQLLKKLGEIDLTKLSDQTGSGDLKKALQQTDDLFEQMRLGVSELSNLSSISNNATYRGELLVCSSMPSRLQNINWQQDTATLRKYITEPYNQCLSAASRMVTDLKRPSPMQKVWSKFASFVKEISSDFLKSI